MSKLRMIVELEYDDLLMGNHPEEIEWFRDVVLKSATHENNLLSLHSNEIGDEIGTIRIEEIL